MQRWQSGLLLIGVGVALNVLGRLVSGVAGGQTSLVLAGMLSILMLGSVVVGIFGLIRFVIGLLTKS